MERLTKQNGCKEYFVEDYYDISGRRYGQEIDKLGRLEDTFEIMEKMETTPVIRKTKDGKFVEEYYGDCAILYNPKDNSIGIYNYEPIIEEYNAEHINYFSMEEYKKTWWLREDKSE